MRRVPSECSGPESRPWKRDPRGLRGSGEEGERVGRKRARLHGVTRKYGAPKASRLVQRGHDVSIRGSLEGP